MEELKAVDSRTVALETLVDVRTISVNDTLSAKERATEFVRQVENPYCFHAGDMIVKNVYSRDGISLKERFEQFAGTL